MDQISQKAKGTEKYFPPEIYFEIVSRLPTKCVGRFTTVSKSWYDFIKSSAFIAAHLNQSIANNKGDDSSHYLLYVHPCGHDCYAYRDNTESFDELFSLKLPMDFESETCSPIGSCNGLLCLTDDEEDRYGRVIYLWNPVIRKYKCITDTSCCCNMFCSSSTRVYIGFWYDDVKHDYKLIRLMQPVKYDSTESSNRSQVELYSVNLGSWRKIDDAKLTGMIQILRPPAFVDGTFNWITFYPRGIGNISEFIILSFDTCTEQFRLVELPKYQEYPDFIEVPYLFVYKGYLAFFVSPQAPNRWFPLNASNIWTAPGAWLHESNIWSIWIMNKPEAVESWVKMSTVETDENIDCPIGVTKNDEIILKTDETMITYKLETGIIRFLPFDYATHSSWLNYTESLVFLDLDDENESSEVQGHLEGHPDENL